MYFTLQRNCFVLNLDSSACLGNKILPDMYSHRPLNTSARSHFNKKKSKKKKGALKANYRQCIKVFY